MLNVWIVAGTDTVFTVYVPNLCGAYCCFPLLWFLDWLVVHVFTPSALFQAFCTGFAGSVNRATCIANAIFVGASGGVSESHHISSTIHTTSFSP